MTNIIELNSETLFYITEGESIIGVGDNSANIEILNTSKSAGTVWVYTGGDIELSREKFKQLCVAWLALNYSKVLKFDEL